MELSSVIHEAKSNLSYAMDNKTVHIRIKTKKDDIDKITIRACDPFNWLQDENDEYYFNYASIEQKEMVKEYSTKLHDVWFAQLTSFEWLRIKYIFVLNKNGKKVIFGSKDIVEIDSEEDKAIENLQNYFNYPYINYEDVYTAPSWVKDTIWYQIFPDRFCNGDSSINPTNMKKWGDNKRNDIKSLFGGDIQGVISKLDYIKDLGISGIYFTPIFESNTSHKYDTIDYFKIDSSFGTNEDFKLLVEECHKRDIKIMLDAVFNHCGHEHPYWQDVLKNGKNSKYFDCFYILDENKPIVGYKENEKLTKEFLEELNFRTFAFTKSMPKWNTGNSIAEKYLLDVAKFWVEEFDIDGWRIDVSNEVSHDFWRKFKNEVTSIKEDIYILGENWDNSNPWLQGDQFHAVMNYEFSTAVLNYVAVNNISKKYKATDFMYAINKVLTDYPKFLPANMFNLLDSHDTPRLLDYCNEDIPRVKIAYAIQMAFSGAPSIYYGGEIGLTGDGSENRRCMPWDEKDQNIKLKDFIKKLISLRKEYKSLKSIDLKWLYTNDDDNVIIFEKIDNDEKVYVLVNGSDKQQTITLPSSMRNKTYSNLINDVNIIAEDTLTVDELSVLYLY